MSDSFAVHGPDFLRNIPPPLKGIERMSERWRSILFDLVERELDLGHSQALIHQTATDAIDMFGHGEDDEEFGVLYLDGLLDMARACGRLDKS